MVPLQFPMSRCRLSGAKVTLVIAPGNWQPRFRGLQDQARFELERR